MPAGGGAPAGAEAPEGPVPEEVREEEEAVAEVGRGAVEGARDDGLWTEETNAIVAAAVEREAAVGAEGGTTLVEGAGESCCILLLGISKITKRVRC